MPPTHTQWIIDSANRMARHRHSELAIHFEGDPDSASFGIATIHGDKGHSHLESLALVREGTDAFRQACTGQQARTASRTPDRQVDGPKITVKKRRRLA